MSDGSSSEDYSSDDDYSDEVSEEEDESYTETETLTEDLTDSMITESESEPSKFPSVILFNHQCLTKTHCFFRRKNCEEIEKGLKKEAGAVAATTTTQKIVKKVKWKIAR